MRSARAFSAGRSHVCVVTAATAATDGRGFSGVMREAVAQALTHWTSAWGIHSATGADRANEASRRLHHTTSAVLHDAESIDASEFGDVGGDDGDAQLQTRATDPEVIGTDQLTPAT